MGGTTRDSILAVAEKLLEEKGYESTSLQEILDELKISKGGFYHYFTSKEAVMEEVCVRRVCGRIQRAEPELYAAKTHPVQKLNCILHMTGLFDWDDTKSAEILLKLCYGEAGDLRLRESLRRNLREQLTPYLEETIQEGVRSGVMCVRYPKHTGKIVLRMADDLNDTACTLLTRDPENLDTVIEITDQVHACRDAIEVLLGAPFGSVWLFDMTKLVSDLRRIMNAIAE